MCICSYESTIFQACKIPNCSVPWDCLWVQEACWLGSLRFTGLSFPKAVGELWGLVEQQCPGGACGGAALPGSCSWSSP